MSCVCVCVGGGGAERQESMCVYNDLGACDYEKSTLSSKMILISSDLPTWEHICSRAICGRSCCLILAISKIFFTEISATICFDTHDRAHDTQGHTHRHAYARAHTHTHVSQRPNRDVQCHREPRYPTPAPCGRAPTPSIDAHVYMYLDINI